MDFVLLEKTEFESRPTYVSNILLFHRTAYDYGVSQLIQILPRELLVMPLSVVELEKYGWKLKYWPSLHTPVITEIEVIRILNCFDQQLVISIVESGAALCYVLSYI